MPLKIRQTYRQIEALNRTRIALGKKLVEVQGNDAVELLELIEDFVKAKVDYETNNNY